MTTTTGFFDAVRQYSAQEFARVLRAATSPGVVQGIGNAFAVTAGPGLGVTIDTGFVTILGDWLYTDSTTAIALLAADLTNPRIDRIIARLTISTKTVELTKLTGTPAGSPVAPSLTQGSDVYEIPLAQIAVAANAASITSGNVTDQRQYAGGVVASHLHTASAGTGGVVPHGNLSNVGTNTHAQLDSHVAANANVHGLPASVGVLGDRTGGGHWVQYAGSSTSATGAAFAGFANIRDQAVTFPVAFSATPVTLVTGVNTVPCAITTVSSTGFTARQFDASGAGSAAIIFHWLAVGS
jgi:hypothetical protein